MDYEYIIVGHRLPVKYQNQKWIQADGGLVSALTGSGALENSLWIGHLNSPLGDNVLQDLPKRFCPIACSPDKYDDFYNKFCNDIIWPIFHNIDVDPGEHESAFKTYEFVNHKFAESILMNSDSSTPTWIHDYHLMLLPRILKNYQPTRKVGFFLHIPWPSLGQALKIPHIGKILKGLCAADIISFHTETYRQNFLAAVRYFATELSIDPSVLEKRTKVTPIGINIEDFTQYDTEYESEDIDQIKIVGVDRFDYSKGIGFKMRVIDRFLEKYPEYIGKIKLQQLLIPTRSDIQKYSDYQDHVEELIAQINKRWGNKNWAPLDIINGRVNREELVELYASGDICLVTSVADGMNLVSLEYLVSHKDKGDGVLVIGDAVGCSEYLTKGAKVFRSEDIESAVENLFEAINLNQVEKKTMLENSIHWIEEYTSEKWATDNLSFLGISQTGQDEEGIDAEPA